MPKVPGVPGVARVLMTKLAHEVDEVLPTALKEMHRLLRQSKVDISRLYGQMAEMEARSITAEARTDRLEGLFNSLVERKVVLREDMDAPTDQVLPWSEVAPAILVGKHGPLQRFRSDSLGSLEAPATGGASVGRNEPYYSMSVRQRRIQAKHETDELRAIPKTPPASAAARATPHQSSTCAAASFSWQNPNVDAQAQRDPHAALQARATEDPWPTNVLGAGGGPSPAAAHGPVQCDVGGSTAECNSERARREAPAAVAAYPDARQSRTDASSGTSAGSTGSRARGD